MNINVFGMSSSGSTLLNFMLDCVADIYGGGEPLWLLTQNEPDAREKESVIRLRQFESNHGMFIYNKHLDYFTSVELEQIYSDPRIQYWNQTFRFVQDESKMLIPKAS